MKTPPPSPSSWRRWKVTISCWSLAPGLAAASASDVSEPFFGLTQVGPTQTVELDQSIYLILTSCVAPGKGPHLFEPLVNSAARQGYHTYLLVLLQGFRMLADPPRSHQMNTQEAGRLRPLVPFLPFL